MSRKYVTEAIVAFMNAQRANHPGKDLLDRYLEYGSALETQVNVAAGDGEPVAGKRATWTDGINQWWNLRIPKNAWDEPEFRDYKLSWPLEVHAEGIGTTGWDWMLMIDDPLEEIKTYSRAAFLGNLACRRKGCPYCNSPTLCQTGPDPRT